MNPFLTVYKKDYIPVKIVQEPRKIAQSEFKDPINEGFKNYLSVTDSPVEPEMTPCDQYMEEFKADNKKIGEMYFSKTIDKQVVKNSQLDDMRTVYRRDYEDIALYERFLKEEYEKKMFRLPSDWNLPQTTQTASYRNPSILNPNVYEKDKLGRTPDNLVPNPEIRRLLKITTGVSDYGAHIGQMGETIIKEEIHGKRNYPACHPL
ncbi:uncharacterized protein LOC108738370 [Agrilus planipennis]|uniref:Uncharacterized protein LOC108738370 n=1 Tax=Agrilus planipennis TaxID=224129 RepID=A0A7F5RED8_AGRPL|nr:uncharacterized protein LOC108738370 [Agrilus planipennis]